MGRISATLVALVLVFGMVDTSKAATVCASQCDETTIGAVIADPKYDGEDIIVFPGTYMESNLNIVARNLISNSDNPADTIINGGNTAINGGVLNVSGIGKTIRGFTITGGNNTGDNGGGINVSGSITLQNLIIQGNRTDFAGGGVGVNTGSTVFTIIDSTIQTNTATSGGGIFGFNVSLTNTDVLGNTASNSLGTSGGGIHVPAAGAGGFNTLSISGGTISGNSLQSTTSTAFGGGIAAGDMATFTNVTISGNTATGASGSIGGGIAGAIGNMTINGGSIQGNTATFGGGLQVASSGVTSTTVTGTSVTANIATNTGGGIYCTGILQKPFSGNLSNNTPNEIDGIGCTSIADLGVGDDSQGNNEQSATAEDPVNTFTGELFNYYPADLNLGGPLPLTFSRYYAYRLELASVRSTLGTNWRHNHAWAMTRIGTEVEIVTGNGRRLSFTDNGSAWIQGGKKDHLYQLEETGSGFTLTDMNSEIQRDFDTLARFVALRDGVGNTHTLTYGNDGQLATISDGLGRTLTLTHDANSHLTSLTDGTRTVIYRYVNNNLVGVTNPMGDETVYFYNPNASAIAGLLWSTTEPEGNIPFSQTSFDKQVVTQTNADGFVYSFDYSVPNNTTITDPDGNTRVHTHTATGEFTNRQDQSSQSFSMGYDAEGRRNSLTDRLGDTSSLTYHVASGKVDSVTDAEANITSYSYTARPVGSIDQYDLTGIVHADGTAESLVYDASGNLTMSTDQAGFVTSGTYDANGQVLTATNVAGGIAAHTYNFDGTRASTTDPTGNVTTYGHDALRRLNLITLADTNTQSFTYDNNDNLLTATDENGNVVTLSYDTNNRVTAVTDALANDTIFAYDGNNRLLGTTGPLGGTTSSSYNSLGKPNSITDENTNTTTFGYDILSRLTSITNPLGGVTSLSYDAEAVLTSSTDPLGHITAFSSNKLGRTTQIASPLGNIFVITYDAMGRVSTTTNPLGQVAGFSYDVRGLLSGIGLPETISTSYTRNPLGLITSLTDPGGNLWLRSYDNNGYQLSSTDPLINQTDMSYNNRNRLATVTYPSALGSLVIGYDPAGNLTDADYSDATAFNFTYDANSRLTGGEGMTRAYDSRGLISNSNGIAIGRDAGGRITSMTLAIGKTLTYAYDANDNLISVTDWATGVTGFGYDAANRLTTITRPNGITTTHTYDNDDQLTGITEGTISSIALTRDANGQITAATRNVPLPGSAAPLSDRGNTFDAASQISAATYDAMGRLLNDSTKTYNWNLASLLESYTQSGNTISFNYDALGRRISRSETGVTRDYVWNDALGLASISVEKESAADLRYYIHTPGGSLLYSIDAVSNARRFYHFDEMGNTLFVSSDAGAVIGSYAYSPYGEIIASTGALDNRYSWQGQYGAVDEGNGLYYIRARYYDSTEGRFISRDSIKSIRPKAVNPYQYALNNPLEFVDVTGRTSVFRARLKKYAALAKSRLADKRFEAEKIRHIEIVREERIDEVGSVIVLSFTMQFGRLSKLGKISDSITEHTHGFAFLAAQKAANIAHSEAVSAYKVYNAALEAFNLQKREAHELHLKEVLDKATEKLNKARDALNTGSITGGGSRTRAQQDKLQQEYEDAKIEFEEAGGIESVIPDLEGIVVPS